MTSTFVKVVDVARHGGARCVPTGDVHHQLPRALLAGLGRLVGALGAGVGGEHFHPKERIHQVASSAQVRDARRL